MYMHICGFSGSGKNTLGEKIESLFPDVEVKDLDDFFFSDDSEDLSFRARKALIEGRVFEYVSKVACDTKKIILIGTGCINADIEEFPLLNAENKIWLDISIEESSRRGLTRQIDWMFNNKENIISMMDEMSIEEINEYLNAYVNLKTRIFCWEPLKEISIKRGYISMSEEEIIQMIKRENK